MSIVKPMLASDWDEGKQRFPVIAQPKIDGVRALNIDGELRGRSLKQHGNKHVTTLLSDPLFQGFDGELAAESCVHPDLCRLTTSAVSTREGEPFVLWWLFDYITPSTVHLPYLDRYMLLVDYHAKLKAQYGSRTVTYSLQGLPVYAVDHLRVVPMVVCHSMVELEEVEATWLLQGYEGVILRDPEGMYKSGRSTVREGGLLRIKRFIEEDAVVLAIQEGQSNQNEATINELGHTERSTHQENMVPNGLVGALVCKDVKSGQEIVVSPGRLTHQERKFYFDNPAQIVGKRIKYQHFPKGAKDKPRFPTFQSFRSNQDIGLS